MTDRTRSGTRANARGISADGWLRLSIVAPDEFAGDLLEHALQFRGITTMSRSADPGASAALVTAGSEILLRLITLAEHDPDLDELAAARAVRPTVGLLVLTQTRDVRLLGVRTERLPVGTRVISVRDVGKTAQLAALVRTVARRPLAEQHDLTRLPLTDEQVHALRAVAAGRSNEQIAAERVTTVSAARQLVVRTSQALGIPRDLAPAQARAVIAASHVRLLGGGELPRAPYRRVTRIPRT